MVKPLIVPRIVIIGLVVMIVGAILATAAYIYETNTLGLIEKHPLFDLFADGFKVGLGAFIGVLSQWASRVFADAEEGQQRRRSATPSDAPTEQGSIAGEESAN